MAISFVQTLLNGFDGSSGTTVIATGSKTLTAGNLVIVQVTTDVSAGTVAVTDNLGNSYVEMTGGAAGSVNVVPFYAFVTVAGTLTTLTATQANTTTERAITSMEFSNAFQPVTSTSNDGTSTAPSVTASAHNGLNLWLLGILDTGSTNLTVGGPAGYTQGAGPNSSTNVRQGYMFYLIGNEPGGVLTGSISVSKGWLVVSAFASEEAERPPLAGVSFDGVTIR